MNTRPSRRQHSRTRWVDVASAMVLASALLAGLLPTRLADIRVPVVIPPLPVLQSRDGDVMERSAADARLVVQANILSGSRRAPSVHYVSPELLANDVAATVFRPVDVEPAMPPGATDSTGALSRDVVPRLYGIVLAEGQRRALLRLTERDVAPTLLAEGDQRDGYRIIRIDPDRVTLSGPAGQRTLRLSRTTTGNSTEKRP